ncbi:hypothetical protein V6N12_052951 [Hibiscus sabdariffa]|uniref:Uncharacterized protein n=1 Tax=Hibiscus sabdariffa TaxID=183260 RepID=A0ABR2C336_9ROSI
MRKLARQLQNSEDQKFSLPSVDDDRPMDINEQEELVRSLEKMHAQQSHQWKSVFAALLFCYSAFLLYSIYQQTFFPWELRFKGSQKVAMVLMLSRPWACNFLGISSAESLFLLPQCLSKSYLYDKLAVELGYVSMSTMFFPNHQKK